MSKGSLLLFFCSSLLGVAMSSVLGLHDRLGFALNANPIVFLLSNGANDYH
jgi:hypothetical protein